MRNVLSLWFGVRRPVDRAAYAWTGFGLMALKYALDAALVYAVTGRVWTPLDYLSPLLSTRQPLGQPWEGGATWLLSAMVALTIPFAWVGASMTLRRALDAGLPAWTGLGFFVPILNYGWMLLLCLLPTRAADRLPSHPQEQAGRSALFDALWPATLLGFGAVVVGVFVFGRYGTSLFLGTPAAMGFVAGVRAARGGLRQGIIAGQLSVIATGGLLLLFALEGVICLAMAWPAAAALALLGSLLGVQVGRHHRLGVARSALLLGLLPLLMGAEATLPDPPLREVVTAIEIDAPPEAVWPYVVGFGELPPPSTLVFRLGIAYPVRARIEGSGVGAVRYCEFSTGAFVEPITGWDPPTRLAFDVRSQPEPLDELSPYQVVHAPHLLEGFRSERGEFRLEATPAGGTRLEGSTWYRLHMTPQWYWAPWSDALIHRIHTRVLAHVRRLAESAP